MAVHLFPAGIPVVKRMLDYALIIIFSPILIPLMILLALLVLLTHGKPVIFSQPRAGYQGDAFTIYKFRSMRNERNKRGDLLADEKRLTSFGRILRASSLDELPELFNVLRGEMSIVGPRPLLLAYLTRYNPTQARRHHVLPGITGWAQVNGRNNLSWEAKFELDVWYVDHWSIWVDLLILLRTIWKVVAREGINQPGNATAKEFMGSPEPESVIPDKIVRHEGTNRPKRRS